MSKIAHPHIALTPQQRKSVINRLCVDYAEQLSELTDIELIGFVKTLPAMQRQIHEIAQEALSNSPNS